MVRMKGKKFGDIILSESEAKTIDRIVRLVSSLFSIFSPKSKCKNKEDNTIENGERKALFYFNKNKCIRQQYKTHNQSDVIVKPSAKVGNRIPSGIAFGIEHPLYLRLETL